ncbi:3341_t:CDS:1, partial [Dentiscutata erythropus]
GVQIYVNFKKHQINGLDLSLENRSEVIPHFHLKNITVISSSNMTIAEKNSLDIERIKDGFFNYNPLDLLSVSPSKKLPSVLSSKKQLVNGQKKA